MTTPRRDEWIQGTDDNYRRQVVVVDSDGNVSTPPDGDDTAANTGYNAF